MCLASVGLTLGGLKFQLKLARPAVLFQHSSLVSRTLIVWLHGLVVNTLVVLSTPCSKQHIALIVC